VAGQLQFQLSLIIIHDRRRSDGAPKIGGDGIAQSSGDSFDSRWRSPLMEREIVLLISEIAANVERFEDRMGMIVSKVPSVMG
jgi:hypothetical protein